MSRVSFSIVTLVFIILVCGAVFALLGYFYASRSLAEQKAKNDAFSLQLQANQTKLEQAQELVQKQNLEIGHLKSDKVHLEQFIKQLKEQDKQASEKFKVEFENLASKILKQNSDQFSDSNKKQIGEILSPLKEKLNLFEKRINDVYTEETKQRSEIKQQIVQLMQMNQVMSNDAKNLTKALKGDNKAQGNWGELVLERVLESSGLIKDHEYVVQHSDQNAEGVRVQPDVVVNLPDSKHLIIDSKVSLLAYDAYVNADTDQQHEQHLKNHLISVKTHIKNLSEKRYETAKKLQTPDFVLLFMPLEGAFSAAIQNDSTLYAYAWKHNIVLVSPTTLLATLKTIASIWKQERQTKNAIEIAEKAGGLYDKFVGFLSDMEGIDRALNSAQKAFFDAKNKLSDGKGNLVTRAEGIKKLGAKAAKQIPDAFKNSED